MDFVILTSDKPKCTIQKLLYWIFLFPSSQCVFIMFPSCPQFHPSFIPYGLLKVLTPMYINSHEYGPFPTKKEKEAQNAHEYESHHAHQRMVHGHYGSNVPHP
jgi:hypothetical protein